MALVDIYARHADDGFAWIPKPINKQGPLLNYDATLEEVYELLTIYPQVWIYDSATKKAINLSNLSEYFPDYDPGGSVTPEQLAAALQEKVDKVTGKGLSTNDYTDDDKQKVQSALTKEQFDAGKTVTGTQYTIDNVTVTAGEHAEIFNDYEHNIASGYYSHAEGNGTTASGYYSHAEGGGTKASGSASHAEGGGTTASGSVSHAEGNGTTASGDHSHAEGNGTTASEYCSHAEGGGTKASGSVSHAEGGGTTASGSVSHAEGNGTTASGDHSHAEGNGTTASGYCSHAEGWNTKALSMNQHVQGKCNIEDANNKYAFIIGNGTSNNARSNAFAIDWNGLIYQNNSENGVNLNQMSEKMNKISTTWKGTQAEYDALESKSEYDMYCIYEDDET